jgi:hypothetical protein
MTSLKFVVEAGQMIAGPLGSGGKSEHRRAGCSITWSRGDAKASATESRPPRHWRGKGETVR